MPRRKPGDEAAHAFGAAVRKERLRKDLTLEALGAQIGRPDGKYLGELERGWHSPTISTAKNIADALEVPLAKLVKDL